jgi:hypothetical protein
MTELWANALSRQELGGHALERARDLFGAERFYSGLSTVYASAGSRG